MKLHSEYVQIQDFDEQAKDKKCVVSIDDIYEKCASEIIALLDVGAPASLCGYSKRDCIIAIIKKHIIFGNK
jgi:hypothetical protein